MVCTIVLTEKKTEEKNQRGKKVVAAINFMATQKYFANFVLLYTEDIERFNHPQMTKSYIYSPSVIFKQTASIRSTLPQKKQRLRKTFFFISPSSLFRRRRGCCCFFFLSFAVAYFIFLAFFSFCSAATWFFFLSSLCFIPFEWFFDYETNSVCMHVCARDGF